MLDLMNIFRPHTMYLLKFSILYDVNQARRRFGFGMEFKQTECTICSTICSKIVLPRNIL